MMYNRPPETISPFQRWILLKFHEQPKTRITATDLITTCCITAMDDTFDKESGIKDIEELERIELIDLDENFDVNDERRYDERRFGLMYVSSIDGIIYAKKMMKPILDAMNKDEFEDALRKLDDPQSLRYLEAMFRNKSQSQQHRLTELANFGLNNITGFGKIWEAVHQMAGVLR